MRCCKREASWGERTRRGCCRLAMALSAADNWPAGNSRPALRNARCQASKLRP
jgi:hypothetical protein